jgi:DNA-binding HxlR family transcriptional regulator
LLHTDNPLIIGLVKEIGDKELSIVEMMKALELKHRPNFLEYHLNPAIKSGLVQMKYPDSPRHPRQKYCLTELGLEVLKVYGCG